MRTTPTPDIEGMITGGQERLRRRTTMQIGFAAAAVLLVGGGIYGVTQLGDDDADPDAATQPSAPTEAAIPATWQDNDGGLADPGTYRTFVGLDADGERIEADLTLGGSNWTASNFPVAFVDGGFAGIGTYRADSVAGGCLMQAGLKKAAAEQQELAQQLTRMPRSDVVKQPTLTQAFGHSAVHLRLRVNAACEAPAAYQVAESVAGSHGISYFDETPEASGMVIIDFWVVDLDGTTVVVDMFHSEGAPQGLVDQAAAARESIAFVEAE